MCRSTEWDDEYCARSDAADRREQGAAKEVRKLVSLLYGKESFEAIEIDSVVENLMSWLDMDDAIPENANVVRPSLFNLGVELSKKYLTMRA